MPKFYDVVAAGLPIPPGRIHHTRVIRMEGKPVPFYRRQAENGWGVSIFEQLYDRLVAFDSTTQGVAQLVYKAYLRTLKIEGFRDLVAQGGPALDGIVKQIEFTRMTQSNEGISVFDGTDTFETHNFSFSGLDNVLMQFGQQLSGGTGLPATKLFGQSPAGMNATGESDLENYHAEVEQHQETVLRTPLTLLLDISFRSILGVPPPDGTDFSFRSLKQMSDEMKYANAASITTSVVAAESNGIIDRSTALKELRASSRITGVYTNITDEAIEEAEQEPPPVPELTDEELNANTTEETESGKTARSGDSIWSRLTAGSWARQNSGRRD